MVSDFKNFDLGLQVSYTEYLCHFSLVPAFFNTYISQLCVSLVAHSSASFAQELLLHVALDMFWMCMSKSPSTRCSKQSLNVSTTPLLISPFPLKKSDT